MQERQVQPRFRIHRRAFPSTGSEATASWGLEEESPVGIERGGFGWADNNLCGGLFVGDVDQSRTWIAGSYQYSIIARRAPSFSLPSFSWIAEFRRTNTRPRPSSTFFRRRRRSQRPPRTAQSTVAAVMRRDLGNEWRSCTYC